MSTVIAFCFGAAAGAILVWLIALFVAHLLDAKDKTR